MRVRRRLSVLTAALLAGIALSAGGGNFTATKHGDALNGVQRLGTEPRGDCSHCHDQHASRDGAPTGGPYPYALFAPNDNALCATCHTGAGALGIWPGALAFASSAHAAAGAAWPGPVPPARPSGDAGKCVNCHDPHGKSDGSGLIPSMALAREEALCATCHDGSPAAANVALQLQKVYRHPVSTAGKHDAAEGGDPARYAASPANNRHAECADCHNPHAAAAGPGVVLPPAASGRLLGTGRVRVTNGAAGTKPSYTWLGPGDASPASEYELCFKCHSSWTTLPATAADLGVLLNENNPSFHPVEAQGKNRNIAAGAFANGWTWDRLTYCTDCHTSDDATVRGPHGSAYPYILKRAYTASPAFRTTTNTELCFDCHGYDTYANRSASNAVKALSRWDRHGSHVDGHQTPCFACHATHGSTALPGLVATGRSPGFTGYVQTANGGTCSPAGSCHNSRSYTVTYAR